MGSANIGDTYGSSAQPFQAQTDEAAPAKAAQQSIGIAKDLLEIPLPQQGAEAKWHYQNDRKNPLLQQPIGYVRVGTPGSEYPDTSWQAAFKEWTDALPEAMKHSFLAEMNKPGSEQDPAYTGVKHVIEAWSKTLTELKEIIASEINKASAQDKTAWKKTYTHHLCHNCLKAIGPCCEQAARFLHGL